MSSQSTGMGKILLAIFWSMAFSWAYGQQYYLRGEVKDENNNVLSSARILLHSNNYLYYSDTTGTFEILISSKLDTVTITAEGFRPLQLPLEAGQYQYIILNAENGAGANGKKRLASTPKNKQAVPGVASGEARRALVENGFSEPASYPEAQFAVNPEKISYNNFQRYINLNSTVPPDAIRIEELMNYFNLDYQEPPPDSDFALSSFLAQCPWEEKNQLLFVHANAKKNVFDKIPPANLVFLIDLSGSMGLPNRLPMLKSALRFFTGILREKDTLSIITYGKSTSLRLRPIPGNRKKEILKAIEQLQAGGSLPGDAAMKNAYAIAENQFINEGNNRVILMTDGDFNNGESTQEELEKMIMMHKRWGIYLTCFGIGMETKKNEKLQVLTERGGGNMAYIDDEQNAEKALMREFAQIVFAAADHAWFSVQLDPDQVRSYRLIGYENRLDVLADTASELTGGQVGSGNSIMALFEIAPAPDSVRKSLVGTAIGSMALHYGLPGDTVHKMSYLDLPARAQKFSSLPTPYRFAASIALCGGLIKRSAYFNQAGWNLALSIAEEAYNKKDAFEKDFIELMQRAKKIYAKGSEGAAQ